VQCCSYKFTAKDIKPPLVTQQQVFGKYDPNLLGGRVKRFSKARCPECGREWLLWLKPVHQSYEVAKVTPLEPPKNKGTQLEDMGINELRKLAKEVGIKSYVKYTKAELIEMLKQAV